MNLNNRLCINKKFIWCMSVKLQTMLIEMRYNDYLIIKLSNNFELLNLE